MRKLLSAAATFALTSAGIAQTLDPRGVTDRFSELYPARAKTFVYTSTDPNDRAEAAVLGNDDGFTGINSTDRYSILRGSNAQTTDGVGRTQQPISVLAHIQGRPGFMGLFFRNFWSDAFGQPLNVIENNSTEIWVDGTLRYSMPLTEFFRRQGRRQIAPFDGPFTTGRSGGHLTYTPITWRDEFQLLVHDNAFFNASRFHKVAGTVFAPDDDARVPDLAGWEAAYRKRGSWPHRTTRTPRKRSLEALPGLTAEPIRLRGPSTILELTVTVDDSDAWNHLWARFTWDDLQKPSVDVPLRLLGGMMRPGFSNPVRSILLGNDGDHRVTTYFPMHFASSAKLEFVNRGPDRVELGVEIAEVRGAHLGDWGYFTAMFDHGVTTTDESFLGPRLANVRGMLRGILLETSVTSHQAIPNVDGLHLEGDLCVRINGNRGDEHSFCASETSIGKWGWYGTPADRPFDSDFSFQSGVKVQFLPDGGYDVSRLQGSLFVFDPIHFVDGIDLLLEHGVRNRSNAEYCLVTLWYLQPGAARETFAELDVGDAGSEAAFNVTFDGGRRFVRAGSFFRDPFFETDGLEDDVRRIGKSYRFHVDRPLDRAGEPLALGFRLFRPRYGAGGIAQADIYVDGILAGLLHSSTSNHHFRWKEGGELEVELPRKLTDGKERLQIEVRPRADHEPVVISSIKLYRYTR